MKLTCALLFSAAMGMSAVGNAQTLRVNIQANNVATSQILSEIEKQTDYLFVYNKKEVDLNRQATVHAVNQTTAEVLSNLFEGTDIVYAIEGENIMLMKRTDAEKLHATEGTQQARIITGIVTDKDGIPVIGANVVVKGTTNGTITDMDGKFSLEVPEGATLEVSYIGYTSEVIRVGHQKNIDIMLREDSQILDEMVVVGYGTQKKVNLTGAVGSVNAEMLENRTTSSPINMLTGQIAGVTITQNTGQPGVDAGNLRIRGIGTLGNAEAMVVIDGVESSMDNVNPNDIESISVLKDAAASAIYGVRAANGVILITTKRGTEGKPVVSYNGYVGWQAASRLPKFLDAYNYAVLLNEAYANDGASAPYSTEDLQKIQSGSDPDHFANSDQVDALLSENGLFHNHHLSVIGGNENVKYSLATGFHKKDGLMPNMSYNRFNVRSNIDAKINKRLDVALNLSASRDDRQAPASSTVNDPDTDMYYIMYHAFRETPVTPIQFSNGNYGLFLNEHNSVAEARNSGTSHVYNSNFQGSASFNYKIIDGLSLKGLAAATFYLKDTHVFQNKMDFYSADSEDPIKSTRSMVLNTDKKSLELNLQAYLNYEKTFGKHGITALLGYSQIHNEYRLLSASRKDLPSNNMIGEINAGDVTTQETEGTSVAYALRSVFGRFNYDYDSRYLFEANVRYDGSSRFPKNNRFGLFPSFSLGWRISEEAFFNAENIDNLKLRASWGQLGNQEIGDYAFYNTYVFGMDYAFNNQLSPGVSINETMGNSNITWEKTSQLDLGIDIDAWNGKLSATFDYFDKKTNDILLALPTPDILGVSSPMQNAGSVLNRGFEFSITHRNRINDFSYGVNFNFSYVHNEITDLKGADQPGISVGDPVQNVFGYICDGIFRSQEEIDNSPQQIWGAVPGDLKYRDVNGDNVVDDDDRVSIGSDFPSINYGFRLEMGYKNFDFSTLLQGAGDVHALVRDEIAKPFHNGGKVTSKFLDSWTPENPDASCPRLSIQNATKNKYVSTYWVQNASYLKMRNIQLGYTFAPNITKRLGLSRLRMYFSADNVFTITSFEGVDPESTGNNYPLTRSYSFGVNVSF